MITRAVVTLNKVSQLPEDAVQNVWHFGSAGALTSAQWGTIRDALRIFYREIFHTYGSNRIAAGAVHSIKRYDLTIGGPGAADDFAGSPVTTSSLTLDTTGTSAAPDEIALCLSLNGTLVNVREEVGTTRPASRRRGRIFLGPFSAAVMAERPGSALINKIMTEVGNLNLATSAVANLGVYSRKDGKLYGAVGASVDDAWDIQRRRGIRRSAKTSTLLSGGGEFT